MQTEKVISDLNNITKCDSKQFPEVIMQSIKELGKHEGYIKFELDIQNSPIVKGNNYTGNLYVVDIRGDTENGKKETSIFIKYIKPCDHITMFSVAQAYNIECYFYKELAKKFMELQDVAQIPTDERFKTVKIYEVTHRNAIFMENLMKQGYYTLHRMEVMPLKFAELTVKKLAEFHGLSYALKALWPEYFEDKLKNLKQPLIFNEEWKAWFQNVFDASCSVLDEKSKIKATQFIPKAFAKFPEYMEDTSSHGCTICHGDYRAGNILVKETDGSISEVIPVDFQNLYYGCPLNDFMNLVFNGSNKEFRKNHLNDLKNLYYQHLAKFLSYFSLDIYEIYPRKEFERQFTERLELGLIIALYTTPYIFNSNEHAHDFENDDLTKVKFVTESGFQTRIQEVVDDFIQWGYL